MICFAIHAFNEPPERVIKTVAALRWAYPGCQVIFIEDGGRHYMIAGVPSITGERLKTPENGGRWTNRYLSLFLAQSTFDILIKVDPDTEVIKPASNFPKGNVIFSSVYTHNLGHGRTWRVPHGGALGFTRDAAREILSMRTMLNPRFINNPRYGQWNDVMLADVIEWRNMNLLERQDFACGPMKFIGPETTFTHP